MGVVIDGKKDADYQEQSPQSITRARTSVASDFHQWLRLRAYLFSENRNRVNASGTSPTLGVSDLPCLHSPGHRGLHVSRVPVLRIEETCVKERTIS